MRQFQESIRPYEGLLAGPLSNWEHRQHAWEHLGVLGRNLVAPATNLGAPAISLGVPRITVEQSGQNNIFFGNAAGVPGNYSYYSSFNDI